MATGHQWVIAWSSRAAVEDVAAFERPPFHGRGAPGGKIIVGHRQIARCLKRLAGMRTNIARPSRHQHHLAVGETPGSAYDARPSHLLFLLPALAGSAAIL